ncbi:MAG: hypothetical protein AB7I59_03745 [Geminicoccaceae bacterium]
MADPPPTDPAARRAERARRNGARSRGPVSERGKARSSRNALRHGLTAKVHLVLDRDDEAGFMALADSLDAELAPCGTLEGFLVARLTAAMWHTGRAERMEARAFAAATDPDPERLRLAMRYRGSVQRELFRCLRALQELRSHPLAAEGDAGGTGEPGRPETAAAPADPARTAAVAWGGERAGAIPPGFLELRPVPQVWPIAWRFFQDRAFPGDVPLLVYADGTVRSPDGRLLEDVWSPGPLAAQASAPAAPPAPVEAPAPTVAVVAASASEVVDSEDERNSSGLLSNPPLRNEPTQAIESTGFPSPPNLLEAAASRVGLGRTAPELDWAQAGSGVPASQDGLPILDGDGSPTQVDPEPDCSGALPCEFGGTHTPSAWERMWGVPLLKTTPKTTLVENDTHEPDAVGAHGQTHGNDVPPCTSELEAPDRHEEKYTNELSPCTGEPEHRAEAAFLWSEVPIPGDLRHADATAFQRSGRRSRIRRRRSKLPQWQHISTPESEG